MSGTDHSESTPSASPLREIVQPFVDAARAPRPLWGNNLQYLMEGFLYFGIINYLVIYCVENIGTNELQAGWVVTILAGGITFTQFLMGGLVDRWGVRRGLMIALGLLVVGRAFLAAAGTLGLSTEGAWSPAFMTLMVGIGVILLGYGLSTDNIHSPNEKFHLDNFWRGARTSAILLEEAAKNVLKMYKEGDEKAKKKRSAREVDEPVPKTEE